MAKVNNTKSNNTKDKVINGGTYDIGLGSKTLAEAISFQVNLVPLAKEGKPLSVEQMNKLLAGSGGKTAKSSKSKAKAKR